MFKKDKRQKKIIFFISFLFFLKGFKFDSLLEDLLTKTIHNDFSESGKETRGNDACLSSQRFVARVQNRPRPSPERVREALGLTSQSEDLHDPQR
jgi:hypothetical protein